MTSLCRRATPSVKLKIGRLLSFNLVGRLTVEHELLLLLVLCNYIGITLKDTPRKSFRYWRTNWSKITDFAA